VKGLSLAPAAGKPPPRLVETAGGMLNAIGLQNIGVKSFLLEKLPRLRELGATVIANVWGDLEEDYVAVVRALEGAEGIAAVELNISCPNVRREACSSATPPPRPVRSSRAFAPRPAIP
jgi:dihydroorotate dehydrogenase (NAD+) catalytic subunit